MDTTPTINVKEAIQTASELLLLMVPTVIKDSVLLEEVENRGDGWVVSLSFSIPNRAGASPFGLSALQGGEARRMKRFSLAADGTFLSMKDAV